MSDSDFGLRILDDLKELVKCGGITFPQYQAELAAIRKEARYSGVFVVTEEGSWCCRSWVLVVTEEGSRGCRSRVLVVVEGSSEEVSR